MQLQQFVLAFLLAIVSMLLLVVQAQGPYPPRLSIPGAVPVGGPAVPLRPQFRNEKIARVRRPVAVRAQNAYIPSAAPRIQEESKPVTESTEEEQPDIFLPQLLREQQLAQVHQQQFQQQANDFLNSDANAIQDAQTLPQLLSEDDSIFGQSPQPLLPTTRFAERPTPAAPATTTPTNNRPVFNDYGIGSFGNQRFGLERPQQNSAPAPPPQQPQRINVIRSRPQLREQRPQYEAQSAPQPTQAPARPRPRPAPARPSIEYNQVQQEERDQQSQNRRQRPVAQTTRKWREENEDGSITWGYENDDGSFKEELIGTDCITKGTYGYIDPDGNKREYHYETGIKCDPNTRETEEELQQNGFVNYEQNTAVLPNGIEVDMTQVGKKKSRRPNAIYRN